MCKETTREVQNAMTLWIWVGVDNTEKDLYISSKDMIGLKYFTSFS